MRTPNFDTHAKKKNKIKPLFYIYLLPKVEVWNSGVTKPSYEK